MSHGLSGWVALQIVITRNKEAVLSEKQFSCHFGQTVLCGYAEAIAPAEFDSFEAFVAEVQRVWDLEWKRVYSASYSGTPTPLDKITTLKTCKCSGKP